MCVRLLAHVIRYGERGFQHCAFRDIRGGGSISGCRHPFMLLRCCRVMLSCDVVCVGVFWCGISFVME